MDVVGHEAKAVDAATELLHSILKKQVEAVPVTFIEENRISGIAAKDNMVDGAGIMKTGFTGHAGIMAINVRKSSLTP
jgi:hypothetical protein